MEELLKLAGKIRDRELREKVMELLKEIKLSNKKLNYKSLKFEESPAGYIGFEHHMEEKGLFNHTKNVTELAIKIAEFVEEKYYPINKDFVIAGALLHDIMRVFDFKKTKNGYEIVGKLLNHDELIGCELYAREFPEEVIYIVINHLQPSGLLPEALIVHFADTIDAHIDIYVKELIKNTLKVEK
ncbi:MAG TPA: HDIG domain-containing protein [Candidatus Aenigmarchaeota archaeon]|nr:HDIG domain-containing protein [Candidatus Aenigmarchaeota archaeon]